MDEGFAGAGVGVGTGVGLGVGVVWVADGLTDDEFEGAFDVFAGAVVGSDCFGSWPYVMPQKRVRIAKSSVNFFILLLILI